MYHIKKNIFCFTAVFLISVSIACAADKNHLTWMSLLLGNTSAAPKISGSITGNGYVAFNKMDIIINFLVADAYARDLSVDPDKIIVMYDGGSAQKSFTINSDGSFDIDTSLFDKNDLVIFVVNSTTKKVFGHLNLRSSADANLDYIDQSKLIDDLELGSVDTTNNCSSSTTLANTTAFSSQDLSKMEKIAISDNALILYQNIFVNPNYFAEIQALYNMDALDNIQGTFSNIVNFDTSNSIGLRPTIQTNLSAFDSVAYQGIYMYPPADVNYTTARDGVFDQLATTTSPVPATHKGTNNGNFYEFGFVETFPEGEWLLKVDGSNEIKGKFSYGAAYPYNENGKSIIPVPQIRLNMDPSDTSKIKSVDVKWYIFNGAQYEEVNEEFMTSIATKWNSSDGFIAPLRNSGQTLGEFKSATWIGNYTMSGDSSIGFTSGNQINMSYNIGQVSYQFLFRAN